jgi:hypothetical protein
MAAVTSSADARRDPPERDGGARAHGALPEGVLVSRRGAPNTDCLLDEALGAFTDEVDVPEDPSTLLVALADHGGGGIQPNDHDGLIRPTGRTPFSCSAA